MSSHEEMVAKHQEISEKKLPRHIKDMIHYFHSLTEIYEYYRGFGSDVPKAFRAEMKRAEAEVLKALEEESNQGGALHHYYKDMEMKR